MAASMDEGSTEGVSDFLKPMVLPDSPQSGKDIGKGDANSGNASALDCILCDDFEIEDGKENTNSYLQHLIKTHKLVISDVKLIADLKKYTTHWKKRFKEGLITEFCSVIKTNCGNSDTEPSENYYLLCDVLPEDKQLRSRLQKEKLEEVLSQQQVEREDTDVIKDCLFCRVFEGTRADLINHMVTEHSFNIGQPNNLVYLKEFLRALQKKLNRLECFFCDKVFKDRHVLKEHMRKKQHKKLNPKNKAYDKYYVINYLELGKNWEAIHLEEDEEEKEESESDAGDDWGDWKEDGGAQAICLFCDTSAANSSDLLSHMKDIHGFDMDALKHNMSLSFYQQVKLVNYIRRQVHQNVCIYCQEKTPNRTSLLQHMTSKGHLKQLPEADIWDQPQYYFPTFENDNLLCVLGDDDETNDSGINTDTSNTSEGHVVIPEDLPVTNTILKEEGVRQELMKP